MKKFLNEFVEFIKQGNLIQIATGLMLAATFNALVKAFSDSFIMPIINRLLGFMDGESSSVTLMGMKFTYGIFISALISFLITGFVLFLIAKAYNRLIENEKTAEDDVEEIASDQEKQLIVLNEIKDLLEKQVNTK